MSPSSASQPHLFLYVSEIADGTGHRAERLFHLSRERNYMAGIRGVLLFDGQHFGQLLIGFEPEVRLLAGKILRDPRHHNIVTCLDRPAGGDLLFHRAGSTWKAGMAPQGSLQDVPVADNPLDTFLKLVSLSDVR